MADCLSPTMRNLFSKAPKHWKELPAGVGCTNLTLEALEKRGLIESTVKYEYGRGYWKWRRVEKING